MPTDTRTYDQAALDALNDHDSHVLLTGNAGTGKTALLNHWRQGRDNMVVTAPTGIAALNAHGETLHRFLHLRAGDDLDKAAERLSNHADVARAIDTLVIDEISMVRADLMDTLDHCLRRVRRSRDSFGGVRLVMVGDVMQLPPVVTSKERSIFTERYRTPWFFGSDVFVRLMNGRGDRGLRMVSLDKVHRQEDADFIRILNEVRTGHPKAGALDTLNRRCVHRGDGIVLCATNARQRDINRSMLAELGGAPETWTADRSGEWPANLTPAPEMLTLKTGARVMLLNNEKDGLWVNGSQGTVADLGKHGIPIVDLDDGGSVAVGTHTWDISTNWWNSRDNRIESRVIGSYSQLPLTLGWAVTIHKSQGLSLPLMRVDLGSRPLFAHGQAYVALSRARTMDGLSLFRPLTSHDVHCDGIVTGFMDAARRGFPQPYRQTSLDIA